MEVLRDGVEIGDSMRKKMQKRKKNIGCKKKFKRESFLGS